MAVNNTVTLDHIKAFFSLDAELEPLKLTPTVTGGLGLDNTAQFPPPEPQIVKKNRGTAYAKKYVEEEEENFRQTFRTTSVNLPDSTSSCIAGLTSLEELSTAVGDVEPIENLYSEAAQQLHSTYYKNEVQYDGNLPIAKYRDQIVQLININQAVIIQGPTGCGKTTQVPQYILDYHLSLGQHCNIIVTQPRKIAAISIARRICEERKWEMGGIVGYQVAMDSKTSKDTRILYATTGVFLQKLVNSRRMDMYTHVILDEVHERDQDTDFALVVVKKLLRTNSKRVKVILMSATIDATIFANYFSLPGQGDPASIVEVQGKSKEVTEHYIQELSALGIQVPVLDPDVPCIPDSLYDLVVKLMFIFDKIEKAEQNVPTDSEYAPIRGSVLIFLPGYDEISTMTSKLRPAAVSRKYTILPLHSSITVEEQTRVFRPATSGQRKVIISTNIAESSITVPDIKYVIDFCLTKSLVCDQDTNYVSLRLEWASKANCTQRKGRAGRVDIGRVYRMVTREFYDHCLPEYNIPELKRCPLTQTVLHVKKLDFGEPQALLALAIDPPSLCDIENAVLVLKQVGALAVTINGLPSPYDGDLTFVGRVMAALPLDVRLSKLIIYGYVFSCLDDCIIIAASLSLKSFLAKPFQRLLDSYKSVLSWADGTFSDCLAYLNAYRMWKDLSTQGQFNRPGVCREDTWARQNFIQLKRIKEVDMLVEEIKTRLKNAEINVDYHHRKNDPTVETLILKIIIAGAFYPYYFYQNQVDEKDILKEISNGDPLSTVVVTGLPSNQGILYYNALHEMLSVCSTRMTIEFEARKAYIQFDRRLLDQGSKSAECASILPAVYFAVKMRDLHIPLVLQVFSKDDADRKMEQLRQLQKQQNSFSDRKRLTSNRMTVQTTAQALNHVDLPPINQLVIQIFISHILNCGHFWARYVNQNTNNLMSYLEQLIHIRQETDLQPLKKEIEPGLLVLAPFSEDNRVMYYRATIEDVTNDGKVVVFYIDYGNTMTLVPQDLREIDIPELREIPALAFQCRLSEVKPSAVKSASFGWCSLSKKWFQSKVNGKFLSAKVYSVVQDVVSLELYEQRFDGSSVSLNSELIRLGFAEAAEESFLSKQNYEERMRAEEVSLQLTDSPEKKPFHFTPGDLLESCDVRKTSHKVRLHGPYSPLEVSFSGMTYLDQTKVVKIDRDSVNSVSLNPEPQDKHQQLLIASSVSLSQRSNCLTIRNTTLMPKIQGLASLLCLIFAPSAEFRTDPERKSYTGALCGLGCDPYTGSPVYHDHDIEIAFDTEIDYQDQQEINNIRMGINLVLGDDDDLAGWSNEGIHKIQVKLREKLLNLVQKKRRAQEPYRFPQSYKWKQVPSEYVLKPELERCGDNPHVLPLHHCINLREDKSFENELKEHVKYLYKIAGRSLKPEEIKCRLCGVILSNPRDVLLHLDTKEHRRKEHQFLN